MTEDYKVIVGLLLIGLFILVAVRFPALLAAFIRRPTARCGDGTLSFSANRCGTCSHHEGGRDVADAESGQRLVRGGIGSGR